MMKRILQLLLLFPVCIFAQQREVFRIDSLPKAGVLLNQGWKWHVGDNPEWKKVDFDDAAWPLINPGLEIQNSLNQIPKSGICWMRLHFSLDSNLQKSVLALLVKQSGAAEIYLNELKIQTIGILDVDLKKVKAFDSNLKPLLFPINKNKHQVLAIRFALQPDIKYTSIFNTKNPGFSASIKKFNLAFESYTQNTKIGAWYFGLSVGVFSLLFMIYLVIFCFYKDQKASLYFSLFFLFQLCVFIAEFSIDQKQLNLRFYSLNLAFIAAIASNLCLLSAIYELFNSRKDWIFWFLFFLILPAEFLNLGYYSWGWHFGTSIFGILIKLKIIHIALKALRNKKKGALLISIASLIHLSTYILFVWTANFLPDFPAVSTTLYILYYLSLPLATALFLGFDFAYSNQALKLKLIEVHELSKKNLEQEQEKKELLVTQNETLERQVSNRTAELNQSLETLKSTQAQLIQSEKLASLGELTAGIAHEIQNPLNFVNNFAEVSAEMLGEMKDELKAGNTSEAIEIADDLEQNLSKINHHGQRASSIVKGMLEHSRTSSGVKAPTDLNALADEYLRLAYHGLRAKDDNFNATLETHFDPDLPKVSVIPQDIGRVLLNLINNAFYAVTEKAKQGIEGYQPTVTISSLKLENTVEIRIEDNGSGIPEAIKDKIFQPFFTTKPTGQGTGLGLSLAYDIVKKGHGGSLLVESETGDGTTFTIQLPDQKNS